MSHSYGTSPVPYFILDWRRERRLPRRPYERKDAYQQYERATVIAGEERIVAATMVAGRQVKSISFYGQKRDLVEIKQERPEYQEIASHVLQDVLNRLDKAFSAFFRRIRNGETPGYPRFKGHNRYDSFTYPDQAGWKFDGWYLHLSKIGSIKVKLHRPLEGKVKAFRHGVLHPKHLSINRLYYTIC